MFTPNSPRKPLTLMARFCGENDDVHIILYVVNDIIQAIADDDKHLRRYIDEL